MTDDDKTAIEHIACDVGEEAFCGDQSLSEYGEVVVEQWLDGLTPGARKRLSQHDIDRLDEALSWAMRHGAELGIRAWLEHQKESNDG